MLSQQAKERFQMEPEQYIVESIKKFVSTSPANRMPAADKNPIFDEPLIGFADGDDPIFSEYKAIIAPYHLTPREALARAHGKSPDDIQGRLSVISWILPIASKARESNRRRKLTPSRFWANARWYGEKFNDALREYVVRLLIKMGYQAVAPVLQPYFKIELDDSDERGYHSNWSERHVAYAAGLGTFSLSDGFITERGIAHRCGSTVTNLMLPVIPGRTRNTYSNCLFYVDGSCRACIGRCPAGAITESGHDKIKCYSYQRQDIGYLLQEYGVGTAGCGLCQVKVPCEFRNPAKNLSMKKE